MGNEKHYYTAAPVKRSVAQQTDEKREAKDFNRRLAKKRLALGIVIVVLFACFVVTSVFAYNVVLNPKGIFTMPEDSVPDAADPQATPGTITYTDEETGEEVQVEVPVVERDYWAELQANADTSMMKNVVNVLLIGVDYADERVNNDKEYVNKNFNSDVMMILAINFDEGTMDMISVPRDTYAQIANMPGFPYKLNFSLTAGGGINDAGFKNVCDSVSGVLGGIPVDYYVAVTMPMLKEVVDIVGGVDFNIDVEFTIQGRVYKKGDIHLDGQGVLDYCRTRKNMQKGGDDNRVNRQKEIMLALFKKIRSDTKVEDIQPLIEAFMQNCYTNMTFQQLCALAVFGYDQVDLTNGVNMRSFTGTRDMVFQYGYVMLDQKKRVQIIQEVYNIEVPKLPEYGIDRARWDWSVMQIEELFPKLQSALNSYVYGSTVMATVDYGYYPGVYADESMGYTAIMPDVTVAELYADPQTTLNNVMNYIYTYYSQGYNGDGGVYGEDMGKTLLDMVEGLEDMCKDAGIVPTYFKWKVYIYKDAPLPMLE